MAFTKEQKAAWRRRPEVKFHESIYGRQWRVEHNKVQFGPIWRRSWFVYPPPPPPVVLLGEWKDVKGFEGLYKISSGGVVLGLLGHFLLEQIDSKGYSSVHLMKGGFHHTKRIHRLVAEAFIDNPDNKPFVHHKDGDKQDNDVTNLEWATQSDNMSYYYQNNPFKSKSITPEIESFDTCQNILIEWRDIKGFEGYKISNGGVVMNRHGRTLFGYTNRQGYSSVTLRRMGIGHPKRINRLVAEAFIENPHKKPLVHHKNTDRENNYVWNLQWVTHKENQLYKYYENLEHFKDLGKKVLNMKKAGCNHKVIAKSLRIHRRMVQRFVNGH